MARPSHIAVIGGGILGLAVGRNLVARGHRITLLEKEDRLAAHQTGHNSGVIHAGIYYRPGSAKARICVQGVKMMLEFCRAHDIPHQICGKVIVAVTDDERPALQELHRRAAANGVPDVLLIGPERLREIEPNVRGVEALHVASTGIVDYSLVADTLGRRLQAEGGEIHTQTTVTGIRHDGSQVVVETSSNPFHVDYVISCAGLYADRIAALDGGAPARIVPFRGEYYELIPERSDLVKGLIYPVPDPRFPFLGPHFTKKVDGTVEAGPNAVLALRREGYRKGQFHLGELAATLLYPGFWRMAARYWRTAIAEIHRSWSKAAFTRSLQRLVPDIRPQDLRPGGAGVRAQALDPNGQLLDDFLLVERPRSLHVCNAPSPAATASLAIAEEIAEKVAANVR